MKVAQKSRQRTPKQESKLFSNILLNQSENSSYYERLTPKPKITKKKIFKKHSPTRKVVTSHQEKRSLRKLSKNYSSQALLNNTANQSNNLIGKKEMILRDLIEKEGPRSSRPNKDYYRSSSRHNEILPVSAFPEEEALRASSPIRRESSQQMILRSQQESSMQGTFRKSSENLDPNLFKIKNMGDKKVKKVLERKRSPRSKVNSMKSRRQTRAKLGDTGYTSFKKTKIMSSITSKKTSQSSSTNQSKLNSERYSKYNQVKRRSTPTKTKKLTAKQSSKKKRRRKKGDTSKLNSKREPLSSILDNYEGGTLRRRPTLRHFNK